MRRLRSRAGFTLIEAMIVVAIVGVLATLAGTALLYGTRRARLQNAAFEIQSMFSVAQMRAASSGYPNYVIFYDTGSKVGVAQLERTDSANLDWTSVNPANLEAQGARLNNFDLSSTNVNLITPSSWGASLPAPFASVPIAASGSGLIGACTFCVAATGGTLGALKFLPNGTMEIATGGDFLSGGAVGLQVSEGGITRTRIIAVTAPVGTVRVFSKEG